MRVARHFLGAALLLALAMGLDRLVSLFFTEYVVRIMMLAGINVILAVALNLISGTTGQFSIGHAGFMAVGAYAAAFSGVELLPSFTAWFGDFWGPVLVFNSALLVGALFAGFAGMLVGIPSLRLRGDYLAIVTLGFGEIIRIFFTNQEWLGAATGYFGQGSAGLPPFTSLFWVVIWAVVVVVLVANLTFSHTGRILSAIREDEIAAESVGIGTTRFKVVAFVVSAAVTGIGGGLFAFMQGGVRPDDFRFERSFDMLIMIILGGLGSITGAVLGGIFVAVSLELMRDLAQYRLIIYAVLLIAIMILRPEGLLGRRELSLRALSLGGRKPREGAIS